MYVCMYVYPSHFNCVGAVSVVYGHTVLVRAEGDRRVQKIVQEPKWGTSSPSVIVLESEDGNKETLHQKRVRQSQKI